MGDLFSDLWKPDPYNMDKQGLGYVIIRRRQSNGIIIEEPSIQLLGERKYILIHSGGGTAFIIKKFALPFIIDDLGLYAIGFAITAAHTCFSVLNFESSYKMPDCGFSKNSIGTMKLETLKCYCKDWNQELVTSNGNPYCLPGDVALCLLLSATDNVEIEELPLKTCTEDSQCSIVGFPSTKVDNPVSIYPYLGNDKSIANQKIKSIFHKDRVLVESCGKVLRNSYLLEISCSGINGMSGSPVIVNGSAVGVFVGGPPLEGQRELLKIASMIKNSTNIDDAWNMIIALVKKDELYNKPIFANLMNNRIVRNCIIALLSKQKINIPGELIHGSENLTINRTTKKKIIRRLKKNSISLILDTIYNCLVFYKNSSNFNFNVAISTNHPLFEKLLDSINKFDAIEKINITYNEIVDFFEN